MAPLRSRSLEASARCKPIGKLMCERPTGATETLRRANPSVGQTCPFLRVRLHSSRWGERSTNGRAIGGNEETPYPLRRSVPVALLRFCSRFGRARKRFIRELFRGVSDRVGSAPTYFARFFKVSPFDRVSAAITPRLLARC